MVVQEAGASPARSASSHPRPEPSWAAISSWGAEPRPPPSLSRKARIRVGAGFGRKPPCHWGLSSQCEGSFSPAGLVQVRRARNRRPSAPVTRDSPRVFGGVTSRQGRVGPPPGADRALPSGRRIAFRPVSRESVTAAFPDSSSQTPLAGVLWRVPAWLTRGGRKRGAASLRMKSSMASTAPIIRRPPPEMAKVMKRSTRWARAWIPGLLAMEAQSENQAEGTGIPSPPPEVGDYFSLEVSSPSIFAVRGRKPSLTTISWPSLLRTNLRNSRVSGSMGFLGSLLR